MKKILYYNNKNLISRQLRKLRTEQPLSQGDLAARMQTMGISIDQQMISKIENNTRFVTDYELACFCEIFGISLREMLCEFYEKYAN